MIERKRGHVVAISSFAGKLTFPGAVTYCATKHGVTGFMDALFDELCMFDQDFIKTTTAYPTFLNTRKDLGDFLDKAGGIPRFEAGYAAQIIVDGIVRDRRHIYIPRIARQGLTIRYEVHRALEWISRLTICALQFVPRQNHQIRQKQRREFQPNQRRTNASTPRKPQKCCGVSE